jgi:hypothetical protein
VASLMRARRPQVVMKLTIEEHTVHWFKYLSNYVLPVRSSAGAHHILHRRHGSTCTICLSSQTKHVSVNVNHLLQSTAEAHEIVSPFTTISQPWTCCAMGL